MNTKTTKIPLQITDGIIFLHPAEISYIKSDDIYAYVHNGTEEYFINSSLKEIEAVLANYNFYRCHRSYIVNLDKVFKICKAGNCKLILENGEEVPVARAKRHEVMDRLLEK